MRVMDGDLVVPMCLRMPTLILPAGRFVQLYYDPDAQGQYASHFPTGGQGFLQPRGDIRTSIVPRNFRILPADVREVVNLYFHREGLEAKKNQESNDCMSTDTEAANTVRRLQLHCPAATASLQMAVREALTPATAARPQEEYHYDSDDSVLDLDEEYLDLAERVVQWQAARQGTACTPPWRPSDFGRPEQSNFNKLSDLRELLNQAEEARARKRVPVQSVAPTPLPFASISDLDRQRQQRHDQTMAKCQSSPLDGNSEREPKRRRNQTPMTPPMLDAVGQNRTRVRTVVAQGQGWIGSWNLIGHVAKVERGRRVAGGVKAGSTVRAEGGQRVASVIGVGSAINTNHVDQEFGHHSVNERCPIGPRGVPPRRTYGAPGTRRSQMTCPNS